MTQPARQISKAKLLGLVKAADACKSRMAEERGALGAKFEAAATSDNFNAKALRPLLPLLKMEPGPQAHLWRTMLLYAEHLGIGTQGDIEDVIDSQTSGDGDPDDDDQERAREAREMGEGTDGDRETDPVDDVLAGIGNADLDTFKGALAEAISVEAVSAGLERFSADHPDLAEAALDLAQARLDAINAELGGGEDMRPKSLREGEATKIAEGAKAAAGKPRSRRKTKAEPAAPSDFGDAQPESNVRH